MKLSDEVRDADGTVPNDVTRNRWADRIATLERELAEAQTANEKMQFERLALKHENDTLHQAVDAARAFVAWAERDDGYVVRMHEFDKLVAAINEVKDD